MHLALDAMGGDFAPEPIIQGGVEALARDPDLRLTLVGDRARIQPLVPSDDSLLDRLRIEHASQVVEMHESPAKALRGKPDSSINVCWKMLASEKIDAMVSAGNTGAVVAGGLASRRFLPGIRRPGIAVTIPSPKGWCVLIDAGANTKPKPEHLFHYGVMGLSYAKVLLDRAEPRIGILNIGSEDGKGTEIARETAQLFQSSNISQHFHGNIEGRDLCAGVVDVIVCDGFTGNIALKTCEGMVEFLMREVANEVLGALDAERQKAEQALGQLHARYHHSEVGGAPLLGIDGVCLICHGGSDARAIRNAVRGAKQFFAVNQLISDEMSLVVSPA